ncbi:MAG: hypothetical protein WAL75_04325 [Terracidiphilus sp.]
MGTIFPLLWRRNLLRIQVTSDSFERGASRAHLENLPHDCGFGLIDDPTLTTILLNRRIPKASPTRREPLKEFALKTAMRLFAKFFYVEAIRNAVHGDEKFTLLMLRIDPLGDCNNTHAKVSKALMNGHSFRK